MKFRLTIIFITMLIMFSVPLSARKIPKKPELSEPSVSASSSNEEAESPPDAVNENAFAELSFRIFDLSTEEIYPIDAEDYVIGAIASEMGANFEYEALVAQGRAAFSCALYQRNIHTTADYDITADPSKKSGFITEEKIREIYGDSFDEKYSLMKSAAEKAMEEVITYDGLPAMTVYHAISSGKTESAENIWGGAIPYLVPVDSKADKSAEGYETTVVYTKDEVLEKLNSYGAKLSGASPEKWFEGGNYSGSGSLLSIDIGSATFSGIKLRSIFSLRSVAFEVSYFDGSFIFTVHGYGHGVGMSQVGANAMAKNGSTADEILAHYYPGTISKPISEIDT